MLVKHMNTCFCLKFSLGSLEEQEQWFLTFEPSFSPRTDLLNRVQLLSQYFLSIARIVLSFCEICIDTMINFNHAMISLFPFSHFSRNDRTKVIGDSDALYSMNDHALKLEK